MTYSSPSPPSIDNRSQTPLVDFSPSEIQSLQDPYSLSLYAKILGQIVVGYDRFSSHIRKVMRPHGTMKVISLMNGFFLIKFSDHLDYENALQNGPWTINYNYIALLPWTPNFKPSETSISRTKVWIRLYELPVEYYDKEALSRIAEEIGPLVKIDPVTESMLKCRFARFCVDLDLLRLPVESVKLPNGFVQKIRYEGLIYQCWSCRMLGHVKEDCPESTSIATQEVRVSRGSRGVLTPPEDPAPDFPASVAGTGVNVETDLDTLIFHGSVSILNDPDISRVNSPGELRIRPLDATTDSSVADTGSGFDVPDISRVESSGKSRTPPFDAASDSSWPPLLTLQITDQESTFIDSGKPCIQDDYFLNSVYHSQANENQEQMTPGSKVKHQAILRGVEEKEVMRDPAEIQEFSNAGLPKVLKINPRVRTFSINVMIYSSGNGNLYRNILTPEIDHTPSGASPSPNKDVVLFFNCRGAREVPVIQALKDLIERYSFSVVVLTETKTSGTEAGKVIGELGFSGKFIIEPVENSGGVWLLWDENRINVEVGAHDQHFFYALARAPVIAQNLAESWVDVYGVDDVEAI